MPRKKKKKSKLKSVKLKKIPLPKKANLSDQKTYILETELNSLSDKFKEIRSLAVQYRDDKETEINNLREEINKLQKMIEESKNLYENVLAVPSYCKSKSCVAS